MTYSQPSELSNQAFDDAIDQAHQALERQEAEALQIVRRIAAIPGLADYARRKRSYGEPLNPWGRDTNLSAQAAILKADPSLAAYLSNRAGKPLPAPDYSAQEAEAKKAQQLTRMAEATEQLKARNAAHRKQQEHIATYGRYSAIHGRVI